MDIREHIISDGPRDFKDVTSHACICGNTTFWILATFQEGELSGYFLDGFCFECGSWLKMPTPE